MKNLLIFLFGAGCGAGGMFLWLHKKIKKELNTIESHYKAADVPFTVGDENTQENTGKCVRSDSDASEGHSVSNDFKSAEKIEYFKLIDQVKSGENIPTASYVMPRDDTNNDQNEPEESIVANNKIEPIDLEEFKFNKEFEKVDLTYYQGDKVLSSENGSVIENPALFIGTDWQQFIGRYSKHEAFIRNYRMNVDYDIFVEDGFYTDEFGDINNFRRD